ncbi:right-handed parallel beta-helix repeat-containing protein [Methylibium sp.]|uniref:right-handed parallel beta-helix repeat-containing protein n=1 Tax=Methylibium sp. TaxID=2067992 RepID=UPI003D118407
MTHPLIRALAVLLSLASVAAHAQYAATITNSTVEYRAGAGTGMLLSSHESTADCLLAVEAAAKKADLRKDSTATCRAPGGNVVVKYTAPVVVPTVPVATWTQCAPEGWHCDFTGTRQVRYGSSATLAGAYVERSANATINCDTPTFGGKDPAPGVAKSCWYSSDAQVTPPPVVDPPVVVVPPVVTPVLNVPTPDSIAGKTVVGQIYVNTNGMVIENVHVTNPDGPCIVINGARDVVIRNSEIGPCGQNADNVDNVGILIANRATNTTITGNVLHDASTLIRASGAVHPITISKNLFYNIRGYSWAFQAIQFAETRDATASTRITCNVIDDTLVQQYQMAGGKARLVEDHINFYNSGGSAQYMVEIAYNRVRGNPDGRGGISGTAMQLGDSPAGGGGSGSNVPGYFNVHDNIVKNVNGQGIAIAGGVGSVVRNNKVDNRGTRADNTGWSYGLRNFDATKTASVSYGGNKGIANLWAFDNDGHLQPPFSTVWAGSGFKVTDLGGNDWQYNFTTDLWAEPLHAACQ